MLVQLIGLTCSHAPVVIFEIFSLWTLLITFEGSYHEAGQLKQPYCRMVWIRPKQTSRIAELFEADMRKEIWVKEKFQPTVLNEEETVASRQSLQDAKSFSFESSWKRVLPVWQNSC